MSSQNKQKVERLTFVLAVVVSIVMLLLGNWYAAAGWFVVCLYTWDRA